MWRKAKKSLTTLPKRYTIQIILQLRINKLSAGILRQRIKQILGLIKRRYHFENS